MLYITLKELFLAREQYQSFRVDRNALLGYLRFFQNINIISVDFSFVKLYGSFLQAGVEVVEEAAEVVSEEAAAEALDEHTKLQTAL